MIGLGDLPGGDHESTGMAVNNLSHVAGYSRGADGWEAFFWTPETGMIGLGTLPGGSDTSEAWGINDLDQVVGYSWSAAGQQAFLWDGEHGMIGLGDLPGGQFGSAAYDINNSMQVVGAGSPEDHLWEAFIWDPGNGMRPLDDSGGPIYPAVGQAINEVGQVTGSTNTAEVFLWDAQEGLINLGRPDPGDLGAYGLAINDVPQVVGYTIRPDWPPPPRWHAFIWDAEHGMRELAELLAAGTPPEHAWLRWACGINNAGQIAAYPDGLLLTPFVLGDLNCDELVDEADIPALLLLLVDPDQYAQSYPDCPGEWAGDVNQDAVLDPADLYALRDFLGSAPGAQPGDHLAPDHISPVP
jgi:probable HAF family extracellular repeat protein